MSDHPITRRDVLKSAATGTVLGLWGLPLRAIQAADSVSSLKITEPIHGAVLNHRHGQETADLLTIPVRGECRPGASVTINGVACHVDGNQFRGEVALRDHESDILAVADNNGVRSEDRIRVVWDRKSEPRYRFAIDDNSFFLRDIAQKNYKSLFDCFYLKMLRDLHTTYGAKFVLNIFYTAADDAEFPKPGGFTLPQFPDRYKGEWRDNADWLRLSFHAHSNMPGRPYQDAPPEKLLADLRLVDAEIRRFAGDATCCCPTVIHFAMVRPESLKPLYDYGVRVLSGDFRFHNGKWDINYELSDALSAYCASHEAWKDFDSGIVFSTVDICCNRVPVNEVAGRLASAAADPNHAEVMDMFTHEQYFWPFYVHYVPDHAQRIEAAIRWVTEHGYKPVFFPEGMPGGLS